MTYYDEIDPAHLTDVRSALLCARLNLHGAKRLLKKGSLRRGVSALYDSLLFGMHYYIARHKGCGDVDIADAAELFQALARAGVFQDQLAFNRLSLAVERLLWQGSGPLDANEILRNVEEMLAKLGVMAMPASGWGGSSTLSQ